MELFKMSLERKAELLQKCPTLDKKEVIITQ